MIDVGLREGVWALVAVLSIYLAIILFRLALPGKAASTAEAPGRSPQTVVADVAAVPAPAPMAPHNPLEVPQETLNELEIQQLRRDVAQLRTEQDFLRSELVALRLDLNEMQLAHDRAQAQAQPQAQYVRPESPQHSEAMLLAGRGIPASQIAEHCGISVAEAELVCALARAEGGA